MQIAISFYCHFRFISIDQHLDLSNDSAYEMDTVKGQIIVSLMSRDGPSGSGNPLAIVGPMGDILGPNDERESPMNQTTNDQPLSGQWNSNDIETATAAASATNDTNSSPKTPPNLNLTNGSNELISRRHSSEILLSLGNENCSPSRSNDAST